MSRLRPGRRVRAGAGQRGGGGVRSVHLTADGFEERTRETRAPSWVLHAPPFCFRPQTGQRSNSMPVLSDAEGPGFSFAGAKTLSFFSGTSLHVLTAVTSKRYQCSEWTLFDTGKFLQSRAEQSRAEQSRAEPSRAEQSRAEQSRAEPSRAEQSRAEQSRAEPSRAEPSRAEQQRDPPGTGNSNEMMIIIVIILYINNSTNNKK